MITNSQIWLCVSVLLNIALAAWLVWLWQGHRRRRQQAAYPPAGNFQDPDDNVQSGSVRSGSHKFDMVTVLFCDIQGFTRIAEQLNPEVLIDKLDEFYLHFDTVIEKYDIEKIKTIGDAYMCASGIPRKNKSNPLEILLAALEMQKYMIDSKRTGVTIWDIRIGIHTGPAITAVLGKKKLTYDIWGDTVNIASRMESSGEPGEINISSSTFDFVNQFCQCEYRGKMPVKYKGELDMYFIRGLKPEWSAIDNHTPNHDLLDYLQLMRLADYEEDIFEWTLSEIPAHFHFHNLKYAYDICLKTEILARAEGLNGHDTLIVRTAAAFYILYYCLVQPDSTCQDIEKLIRRLRGIRFSPATTDEILRFLDKVTRSFEPANLREAVFHDALFDYFGRSDFEETLQDQYAEVCARDPKTILTTWQAELIDFFSTFEFRTTTARQISEMRRSHQLETIQLFTPRT